MEETNVALKAEKEYRSNIEEAQDYIEHFDILETITNVGNDEVFTPKKVCEQMLDSLPDEVWHHPEYKWLNPCSKNGIFEREIALRLDEGLKDIIPDELTRRKHILQEMVFSIGLTKFTSEVARRTLYYCNQANRKCDGIKGEDGHFVNGFAIGNGTWFIDPEGNIKNPTAEHVWTNENKCKYCGANRLIKDDKNNEILSKYSDPTQIEHYAYEFIHHENTESLKARLQKFFGRKNMKFDIIIGNPPYQLSDGGAGASAKPIYNNFIEQGLELDPEYLCMIIPSRWYAGGKGLDDFRYKFLHNRHIQKLVDFPNAKDCFPSSSIGGGVCYFLYSKKYTGDCNFISRNATSILSQSKRDLSKHDILLRYDQAETILDKINKKQNKRISSLLFKRNAFGIQSSVRGKNRKDSDRNIKLLSSDGISFISINDVVKNQKVVPAFKVFISKLTAEHANEPSADGKYKVLSKSGILNPGEVCTESYLIFAPFSKEDSAKNLLNYLHTKFVRLLVLLCVSSINIVWDSFQFVPLMDLSRSWTDQDLYKYFGLDSNEISFIESLIRSY